MMQKQDINANLLEHSNNHHILNTGNKVHQEGSTNQNSRTVGKIVQNKIDLVDLPQYRIKNHCHYNPIAVGTTDYSIFQVEIMDERLRSFYNGNFILEVWTKSGERLFQKVLQEEILEFQWELNNNVLVFKSQCEPELIYLIFLNERKMTSVRHPYEDNQEVDIMYFDNYLIVAQNHSIRFLQITEKDVNTTISQYQVDPNGQGRPISPAPIDREYSGILQNERIVGIVNNHIRHELIFVCCNDQFTLSYYKLNINKGAEKRQLQLVRYEAPIDPKGAKKAKSLERKQNLGVIVPSEVHQLYYIAQDNMPFLLILRKNQQLELVYNFSDILFIEQRMNVARILGCFGEAITYQFHDGSIAYAPSFERINERNYLTDAEYYRQLMQPPVGTIQYDIHRSIQFYQDTVMVNQSLFLVRDNAIFLVNTFTKKIINTYFGQSGYLGSKIISLHKLRQQTEDQEGFKVTTIKVVAIHQNGSLQVFVPEDLNLMTRWQRTEIVNTAMSQNRDPVYFTFQNQNSSNYIYIVTVNHQNNTQRVFQMMYNTQIIEFNNLKLQKGDVVISVNSQSRQRELLGIIDAKYLAVYRNDKGNLIKLYQISHIRYDIRENMNQNSIFYFQRDYALILTKQYVYKINIGTNAIDQIRLSNPIQQGGSAFIDASCFYFLTGQQAGKSKKSVNGSLTQVACVDTSMIEAAFADALKGENQSAIVDKDEKKGTKQELMHPLFSYGVHQVRRMDYDEFNSVLNLQTANLSIIQVPLYHRNTIHFLGMAERSFYLCIKRHGEVIYALDKQNFVSKWSTITGELISRSEVKNADYSNYIVDRELYDRGWFNYTLIYKSAEENEGNFRINKLIKIDEKGQIIEKLSFNHPIQRNQVQHLYFNTKIDKMIELLLTNKGSNEGTYNLYNFDSQTKQWVFEKTLNNKENQSEHFIEWHQKSLFPYSLNIHDFTCVDTQRLRLNPVDGTFKFDKSGNKVKILNTQDGIEVIVDGRTGEVDCYMALQYSFPNTKASFYDKRCGQFFIQEVTSRLQNFYEYVRRQIFLEGRGSQDGHGQNIHLKLQTVDVSAKDYKYKYVIEQSFTQMDSMFFKQFINSKDINEDKEKKVLKVFKKMSLEHIQRFVHNIFPRDDDLFVNSEGNTLLHYLAQYNLGFEVVDFIGKLAKKEGFVIPFLINSDRQTPLDLTVNRKDQKQTNSLIKLLQKTPMDHHSRFISHLIPKLVGEMSVPQLDKYFDRRRFQTGICKNINLMKLKIDADHEMRSIPTTLINDNKSAIEQSLTHRKFPEQTVSLECFDLPLLEDALTSKKIAEAQLRTTNDYEIKLIKSLSMTDNQEIFQQKTVRAFVDFMWPIAKGHIIKSVFLPYIAFIFYYFLYLVVIKRLNVIAQEDQQFYAFTSNMFSIYDIMFKFIIFLGCFYFLFQDFQQIKSLSGNSIVLWTYANILPLSVMMFVVVWDTFYINSKENHHNDGLQKTLYSLTAFLVWLRVVHLLKCFTHTSYLLRMATEILYRIRWLIAFIIISLLSFGFTFYFVDDGRKTSEETGFENPEDGIRQMFYVLLGRYDVQAFENTYQWILLVIVTCFNAFFVFTMLISLSVMSFSKSGGDNGGVWSNEAYQDKASLISLYSYLLEEKAVREPSKAYLLIATVTENRKRATKSDPSNSQIGGGINADPRVAQAKMMKSIDRRLNTLSAKVERALKEIQDKVGGGMSGAH